MTLSQAHENAFVLLKSDYRGAWGAQLVKRVTSAQVMISPFMSSSPTSGSVLTAQSLEPASDSVHPSLPLPPSKNEKAFKKKKKWIF